MTCKSTRIKSDILVTVNICASRTFFFSLNNINYTALLRLFGNAIKVVNLIFIEFN